MENWLEIGQKTEKTSKKLSALISGSCFDITEEVCDRTKNLYKRRVTDVVFRTPSRVGMLGTLPFL